MEYYLSKKTVQTAFPLLDTVSEQPVDVDLTLPDYCPDIERILRCSLIPRVYVSNLSSDRLIVEGGACVRVIYLDSGRGRVRSFEYTAPYSESFALKDSPDNAAVFVDVKPEYINCRALSPRKLSLHGAFSLYARVTVSRPLTYSAYDRDDDLQVLTGAAEVSELCGLCRDVFSAREDIPLGGRPEISSFISHRVSARITELKAVSDKLMLSAEGRLELMYLSDPDEGEPEIMTFAFPVSRIIDCAGASEDCVISPRLDVMTYDISLNDDALGGSGVLGLELKLCFNAMCWQERELSLISDAFSTQREVEPQAETLSFRGCTRSLCFTDISKATVSLESDQIGRVIDVHAERIAVSAAVSGGAPLLSSRLTVSMMFVTSDGETRCVDRDLDLSYNPSVDGCDSVDSAEASVDSLSYRITGERSIEIRAEVSYRITVSCAVSRSAVTAVTADDDAPGIKSDGSLILYYADKGERVWDIAKRYTSRPADIKMENGLDDDVLGEDRMIMIP